MRADWRTTITTKCKPLKVLHGATNVVDLKNLAVSSSLYQKQVMSTNLENIPNQPAATTTNSPARGALKRKLHREKDGQVL